MTRLIGVLVGAAVCCFATVGRAQTDLGLVGVKSIHGRFLQAHSDNGEMHASNKNQNTEETWHLIEVDKQQHIYALLNWDNHKFMSKRTNGCVPAISTALGPSEQWYLVSGRPYGVVNAVAFKSVADGTFMGTNKPGKDDGTCKGEVSARGTANPPGNNSAWPGWWVLEKAKPPQRGKDFWTGVTGAFNGIVSQIKISPADVEALLPLLAG